MSIRKVLLPISGDDDVEPLADMAFMIATMFSAKVEGLFVESTFITVPMLGENTDPGQIKQSLKQAQTEKEQKKTRARQVYDHSVGRFPKVESTFVVREGSQDAVYAQRSRLADISVIGSAYKRDSESWRSVRDAVLFQSGGPVMMAPSRKAQGEGLEKVLIAWKEGLEASRAIKAAQPFIAKANEVHLIAIGEGEESVSSLQDVEEYLQLHYSEVRSEVLAAGKRGVGERLLARAESLGGALLITGAYSHWRGQGRAFGGVTEFMLSEATVPVLMMH